jgi:hypothetical protein
MKPGDSVVHWTELEHQRELFRWADGEIQRGRKSLLLLGAIPNGLKMLRWPALKNPSGLGFHRGMPDIYFLRPCGGWHGLFIELKSKRPNARANAGQMEMLNILEKNGYRSMVCRGYDGAIEAINDYEQLDNKGDGDGRK